MRRAALALALSVAIASPADDADARVRHCNVSISLAINGASIPDPVVFEARGSARRANGARREARDRALRCVETHFSQSFAGVTGRPAECTEGYGVIGYPGAAFEPSRSIIAMVCEGHSGGPHRAEVNVHV